MMKAGLRLGEDVAIERNETLIRGGCQRVDGRMAPDASLLRIHTLIDTELEKIRSTNDGWETLYRDRSDGRLWELFYPQSEMHGGGPESLRSIDTTQAEQKCGVRVDAAKSSQDENINLHIDLLKAATQGHFDNLECPSCRETSVSVWFSHPQPDEYRTWFLSGNCCFHTRAQNTVKPAAFTEKRVNPALEERDFSILQQAKFKQIESPSE